MIENNNNNGCLPIFFFIILILKEGENREKNQQSMGIISFLRNCLNFDKLFYLLLAYLFIWSLGFLVRWEENYENLNAKYFETQNIVSTDCRFQLKTGHFKQSCRDAEIFLKKPRWWRSFILTISLSTFCGEKSCITYLLGPDLYFTSYGGIVWAVMIIVVLWVVLTFSKMVTTKGRNTKYAPPVYFLQNGEQSTGPRMVSRVNQPHVVEISPET